MVKTQMRSDSDSSGLERLEVRLDLFRRTSSLSELLSP